MFKKILITLLVIILLGAAGFAVYYFLFIQETPTDATRENGEGVIVIPINDLSQTAKLMVISQEPVLSPTISDNQVKYYSAANGNIFQSNLDGSSLTRISANMLSGLVSALWPPVGKNKVIGIFDQNEQVRKYYYNFGDSRSQLLDNNIRYVSWSPSGDKIAYQYYNSQDSTNEIRTANSDGSEENSLFQTRMRNLIVEWPSPKLISLRTQPSGLAQSVVYTIDDAGNGFKKVIGNTYGMDILWSPLGNKILYSETNGQGKNLKLKLLELGTQSTGELDFVTLPDKCTWSQDNRMLFCAIPKVIATNAVMPDDYYKGLLETSDSLYKINLDTGQKTLLFDSDSVVFDASHLILDNQENYLIFVNNKDNILYSLRL